MGDVFSQEWKNPQEAFEYIDVNGDGGVDFGEIKAALSDASTKSAPAPAESSFLIRPPKSL